jgi:hypothetical protein
MEEEKQQPAQQDQQEGQQQQDQNPRVELISNIGEGYHG